MKKRIIVNIYTRIVIGGIVLFSLALLACPELPSDGGDTRTKKDSTPPSPYPFSLAEVLYDVVQNKKIPAYTEVNDDKSKAAGIIFRGLGATAGDTLSVIHVDDKGDDANDGSAWTKAKRTIKDALAGIKDASATKLYLVLIGSGTYEITETLNMQNYVAIIGGFDASSDEESGYESNTATVISGGDSVQVFKNKDLDTATQKSTAVLAGVTITRGKSKNGGGMLNENSSPTITHTTFSENAASYGGGMSNEQSSPKITDTKFSENNADYGGGMYNKKSSPTITHTTFSENTADSGGGMSNDRSFPKITHTTFSKNTATQNGGGMSNYENSSPEITHTTFSQNIANYGGGMLNKNSSPTITHATFSGNTATNGGRGMGNVDSSPKISSSIFWGNTDNSGNNSKQIENSDGSIPVVAHSIVQGGYTNGTAITIQNPLLDTLKNNGGFVETIAIKTGSPAINKGLYVARTDTTYYYSKNGTDWFTSPTLGEAKKEANLPADAIRYTTDARGSTYKGRPDMGAYEYEYEYEGDASPTEKGSTPPSPYSFSLAKILYAVVQNKKMPAYTEVNDDKSKAAGIIFRDLGAKEGDTLSVIHVDDKGDDVNDGSTWTKAKRTINAALAGITDASATKLYLVLIGSGTYEITETLNMQNYVAIIGGFDASSDEESGYESNTATVISGGDSVQVFKNKDLDTATQKSTAVLAGVTITRGKSKNGGGMLNENSSPTITHTTFSENAASYGGGMSNEQSSPKITDTKFSENNADYGGGMYNKKSSPTITHTTFSENTADSGGGMSNSDSSPKITNTTFSGNTADSGGGMSNDRSFPKITHTTFSKNTATQNGGGMYNYENSSPEITHTTFSQNIANYGGGMLNKNSSPTITHATFSGNTATNGGRGMGNVDSSPKISSSIFWGNTDNSGNNSKQIENSDGSIPVVAHSIVQGGYTNGTAITIQNPLLDTLKNNGGFVETIAIKTGSPAINKGLYVARTDTTYYYSKNGTDWFTSPTLGEAKKEANLPADAIRYTTDARGSTYKGRPDMGAYEYEYEYEGDASPTEKGSTPPSPYSFSLAKILYAVVQNKKMPAYTEVNDDKSKAAGIIFRDLGAKEGDTLSVIHVDDKGDDVNDGSTWTKAKRTINAALAGITDASATKLYLVLIGSGTYEITETLNMQNYVAIIGGFDASSDEESGYESNTATVISGGDSVQVFKNKDLDTPTKSTAVLAGVTITKGKSKNGGGMLNENSSPTITHTKFSENNADYGGGMYNHESSPKITDTKFSENNADYGGGMYNKKSSPKITDTIFSENKATRNGGGMYNDESSPTIKNTTKFSGNTAKKGGGMYNNDNSSPTITRTTFSKNTATQRGGGMYNHESSPKITLTTFSENTATWTGGGMYNDESSPTITRTTFSRNTARQHGGGMYNHESSPKITLTTFSKNTATWTGGGMYNHESSPTITRTTFSENTSTQRGGGMYNKKSSPTITRTTFSENTSTQHGGGMYNENSSPTITHTTFSENTSTNSVGGGMYNKNSSPIISSSIFWGNTDNSGNNSKQIVDDAQSKPVVAHSIVQDGYGANDRANNIIHQDPRLDTLKNNGGFVETIAIKTGSPAINKGLYVAHKGTTYYYSKNGTDWFWFTDPKLTTGETSRLPATAIRYTTDARGSTYKGRPDMGAYEYKGDDSPTEKGSTSPSPYSFSLAKVLYAAVKNEKVPADTVVNDDKSKAAGIIFRGLGAKAGDTLSVIHVDDKGDDANDGSTWTKAKLTIKSALDTITSNADASANKLYLVLIGSGDYEITETLNMQNYVAIIGGFDASSDEESGYESNTATVISGGDSVQVFENKDLDTSQTRSTAVLAGVTITRGKSTSGGQGGGGMYNEKSSPTITHTTFSENTASYGGGMSNQKSSPKITETTFSENTATQNGGGMYNVDSSPTIKNTTKFSKNIANDGGGMYNNKKSSPKITDTTFSENTAENDGGGMYNDESSPTITHTTFSGNTAENDGGGIYNEHDSSPTITHTTFSKNTANWGGGMSNFNSSPTITDTTFSKNTANWGGGMYNNKSSPKITDPTFSENTAENDGGGMYNKKSSPTITDTTFFENTAENDGGGMYNYDNSSPKITNTTFSENNAENDGGGMYNYYNSSPKITHTTFSGNTAENDGGGIYNEHDSSPTITHTTFSKNTAKNNGGGMYNYEKSSPTISSSIFWGNTDNSGNTSNQIENDSSNPVVAHSIVQGGYADGTAIIDQDPLLDTLKDNGGFVKTIAISAKSPAINMGLYVARTRTTYYYSENGTDWFTSPTLDEATKEANFPADATRYTTDARGYTYKGRPDIGAYEYEGTAP